MLFFDSYGKITFSLVKLNTNIILNSGHKLILNFFWLKKPIFSVKSIFKISDDNDFIITSDDKIIIMLIMALFSKFLAFSRNFQKYPRK